MDALISARLMGLVACAALARSANVATLTSAQEPIEAWRQILATGEVPAPRWDHSLTADDQGKSLFLFAGRDQDGVALGDLWQFKRSTLTWAKIDAVGPNARFGHAVATDQGAAVMYLFGGQSADTFYNDLWALDLANGTWQRIDDGASAPSPRYGTSLVLATDGRLIVSHGFTFEGRFDDTWAYDIDSGNWTAVTSPSAIDRPIKRCLHEAVWSSRSGRMLLFGGCSSGFGPCPQGDLWAFDPDGGTWSELQYPGNPPARSNPGLVLDEPRDQLLLVGGLTEGGYDGGLSVLRSESRSEPRWIQPNLVPGPTPRASHDMVMTGPHLYLFGGNGNRGVLNDLWTLDVRELR